VVNPQLKSEAQTRKRRTLTLSAEELYEITGYRAARMQLKVLQNKGLPAFMRPDNTVSLGRIHYKLWLTEQNKKPKSERPQLRPIK
jgi:hypothetical protein